MELLIILVGLVPLMVIGLIIWNFFLQGAISELRFQLKRSSEQITALNKQVAELTQQLSSFFSTTDKPSISSQVDEIMPKEEANSASADAASMEQVASESAVTETTNVAFSAKSESEQESHIADHPQTFAVQSQAEESSVATYVEEQAGSTEHKCSESVTETYQPDIISRFITFVINYFTTGNVVVRVGVIVLLFGVAFLLKYVAEQDLISIELRLLAVCALGVGLLAFGWKLRHTRRLYSLIVQGGGIGIVYLTLFAAFSYYQLLSSFITFVLMLSLIGITAYLAILQDARSMAILALVAGFLAPVLISTGQGNYIHLFSFYLLLNIGIALIAWFKAWRLLNVLGFVFTVVIASAWGVTRYQPSFFVSVELFLIAFLVLYTLIGLLYARQIRMQFSQYLQQQGGWITSGLYVDSTLVLGSPIVAFSWQTLLTQHKPYALALSALILGCCYFGLARVIKKTTAMTLPLLGQVYYALGLVFCSISLPLALDGQWSSAAWAIEGAGLVWLALRQLSRRLMWFGILLQLLSAGIFLFDIAPHYTLVAALPSNWLATSLIALAAFFSAYWSFKLAPVNWRSSTWLETIGWLWGLCWWYGGAIDHFDIFIADRWFFTVLLAFAVITSVVYQGVDEWFDWPLLQSHIWLLITLMVVTLMAFMLTKVSPISDGGFWLWPLTFAWLIQQLWRGDWMPWVLPLRGINHAACAWMLAVLFSWGGYEFAKLWFDTSSAWVFCALLFGPLLIFAGIQFHHTWPVTAHQRAYWRLTAMPLLAVMLFWQLISLGHPGDTKPLFFIPLLNPIDLVWLVSWILIVRWWIRCRRNQLFPRVEYQVLYGLLGGAAFIWANIIIARVLHHWVGIHYDFSIMFSSALVQAVYSIFWALTGTALMFYSARIQWRWLWISAVVLLSIVVIKLFIIDLSSTGTLARIAAFLVVGSLLLGIGYISPIPPAENKETADPG
ncbi:DUF2339 domain-containing protein [Zooshikella harenae]|uniref:DUF2339 domain-containing protein n=1 Tax=Zooshikella harenae TaxID=2827238 RepID=A0ABS5ZIZ2_9GAMM|nr:DUF2339 domain-containing protein [Zooshikella harenae]MBU2713205.1 DUF2339 domain-containing protein [Zooshikella harenae]